MKHKEKMQVVVIGAGIGGLTAAAVLARAGHKVTVLEAHIYPGGCAGTFYYQGYRFDAGATLAGGFYPGGPMDQVAKVVGIEEWPARPSADIMMIHLPAIQGSERAAVVRWAGEKRWETYQHVFGPQAIAFWRWQEETADVLWDLALRLPAWPPQSLYQIYRLLRAGWQWWRNSMPITWGILRRDVGLLADAFRSVAYHLQGHSEQLRLFVDAQLLISAQTISQHANALYGAAALDLPRRGVVHLAGGMGAVAHTLAKALVQNGGRVLYRKEVSRILWNKNRPKMIMTKRGEAFPADLIIANLPLGNVARLVVEPFSPSYLKKASTPEDGWGAFMVYVGLDSSIVPPEYSLHHQVIMCGDPRIMGEGNTVFLSLSPEWDAQRAPAGRRALTISTHTRLKDWWDVYTRDPSAYEARKRIYTERMLHAAEVALPGLRQAVRLVLPGTPVTFARFTRRNDGWVGGYPQTSLFRSLGPKLAPGLWMVGDSIFPGQSVPAVALGGLRVADMILQEETVL